METADLVTLCFHRLKLPVPFMKYCIIHELAGLLVDGVEREHIWNALVKSLQEAELESEVVELLCIPFLANTCSESEFSTLLRAIKAPSPLAHVYMAAISGKELSFVSWSNAHSGEAPEFFNKDIELRALLSENFLPKIFHTRMQSLEDSTDFPFLKQWAYEFHLLSQRHPTPRNGNEDYYLRGNDSGNDVGFIVSRRSQVGRSAFLRTLSFAYDRWNMPLERVLEEANFAAPSDLALLQIFPGQPPDALSLSDTGPKTESEWKDFFYGVIQSFLNSSRPTVLLHLDTALPRGKQHQGEIEIVSCVCVGTTPDPERVFDVHDRLLGSIELPRHPRAGIKCNWDSHFQMEDRSGNMTVFVLLPAVAPSIGYLNADFIHRPVFLPASTKFPNSVMGVPRVGGMDVSLNGTLAGECCYWQQDWYPWHNVKLGGPCGVSLTISLTARQDLFPVDDGELVRFWRARILTREKDYGDWTLNEYYGVVNQ